MHSPSAAKRICLGPLIASGQKDEEAMRTTLQQLKLVPVVMIHDYRHAVPLARALHAGGIGAIEVTLRTQAAWDAATAIRQEVPELLLGIGTIVEPGQLERAQRLGAGFAVSPGSTPAP